MSLGQSKTSLTICSENPPGGGASRDASSPRSRTTSAKVSDTSGRATSCLRKRSSRSAGHRTVRISAASRQALRRRSDRQRGCAVARVMILVVVEVVHSRLAPSPALGELLGIPANGFFESPVRGWATYYRRICVCPWT